MSVVHKSAVCTAFSTPPCCIADVMYIDDAVAPLVKTLAAVSAPHTYIYVAHGRNRQAEATFMRAAEGVFEVSEVPVSQLDDIYHCSDVSVLLLSKRH